MARLLTNVIKIFEMTEENRGRIDLAGGLRLNPDHLGGTASYISLPHDPANGFWFDLGTTHSVATWVTNPTSVKEWLGFQVDIIHVYDANGTKISIDRYRLGDGTTTYWWDGGAWTAASLDSEWNTEGETATNIATFPATTQSLQIFVNLQTPISSESPKLLALKVIYGGDISHIYDYVTVSLTRALAAGVTPIGRVNIQQQDTGTEFVFDTSDIETPYDVIDIDSVYDLDSDPNEIVDLASSYDSGSKIVTLNASVNVGTNLRARFTYRPQIAVRTSRDYTEVEKTPSIQVESVLFENTLELREDHVINVDTQTGIKIERGRSRDIVLSIRAMADKLFDYQQIAQDLAAFFIKTPLLRSVGLDEEFTILIDGENEMSSSPSSNDETNGRIRVRVLAAVFYERGSTVAFGVNRLVITGSGKTGDNAPLPGYRHLDLVVN